MVIYNHKKNGDNGYDGYITITITNHNGSITITITNHRGSKIMVIFNPGLNQFNSDIHKIYYNNLHVQENIFLNIFQDA